MKVWAVLSESYSDTGIDAIFSTKELAEKHIHNKKIFDYYGDVYSNPVEFDLDQVEIPEYSLFLYGDSGVLPYARSVGQSALSGYDVIERDRNDINATKENRQVFIKVKYNANYSAMEKSAIDKYFEWKATKEGIS
jgi:hypothetical protein